MTPEDYTEFPTAYPGLEGLSWMAPKEIEHLVRHLPVEGGSWLEIGSAAGVTTALVGRLKPSLRVVSVDTFQHTNAEHMADCDPQRQERWHMNNDSNSNASLFVGTVQQYEQQYRVPLFDAVLCDAGHRFHEVYDDLLAAERLLRRGGWVLVHDYLSQKWYGVAPAVVQFCWDHRFAVASVGGMLAALKRLDNDGKEHQCTLTPSPAVSAPSTPRTYRAHLVRGFRP